MMRELNWGRSWLEKERLKKIRVKFWTDEKLKIKRIFSSFMQQVYLFFSSWRDREELKICFLLLFLIFPENKLEIFCFSVEILTLIVYFQSILFVLKLLPAMANSGRSFRKNCIFYPIFGWMSRNKNGKMVNSWKFLNFPFQNGVLDPPLVSSIENEWKLL